MPAHKTLSDDTLRETLKEYDRNGRHQTKTAVEMGISRGALQSRLIEADRRGVAPASPQKPEDHLANDRVLTHLLRGKGGKLDEIAAAVGLTKGQTLDALDVLASGSHNLQNSGDIWSIDRSTAPAYTMGASLQYVSRVDNTFCFGITSDNHAGSKYERLDALTDSYRRFEIANVDRVFHCGNYIEGEARFNTHDIHTRGMDNQINYLIETYPRVGGIETYVVSGDDHEGWYAQREGIDIGRHTERMMRGAGRTDWHDLGFMEAHVELVNANTGKSSVLAVVHPGGGASYADSYVVQKILESLDGGEKPAVALYGHYHKMLAGEYRNVWWVLVPSTKDQDPFLRKKRIRSVVGGGIVTLEQDPETGAIIGMTPHLWRYFVKSYYTEQNRRWSHSGPVTLPARDTR